MSDTEEEPRPGPEEFGPEFPDPGPLRRMQAATAALMAGVAVIILLSDKRPAEVRWGSLIGLVVLVVVVGVVLRRRRREPPRS